MVACGDVLLLKDGAGVGKCARIDSLPKGDSTVNSSLTVITCFDNLNYRYLYYSFNSSFFSNLINLKLNGMGVPHLTQEELRKFIVLLPCVKEQQQIADFLDTKCSEIDAIIADKKRQLDILAEYKNPSSTSTSPARRRCLSMNNILSEKEYQRYIIDELVKLECGYVEAPAAEFDRLLP